jgi:hypothetical protein
MKELAMLEKKFETTIGPYRVLKGHKPRGYSDIAA